MYKKAAKYINTLKYLRPVQIIGQLTKPFKIKMKYEGALPENVPVRNLHILIPELDENPDYLLRFNIDEIMGNKLTLLHETYKINLNTWQVKAPALWRFNLHYFEYGIGLGAKYKKTRDLKYYDKFKEFIQSWIKATPTGEGDGWHPYTISMRIPNWFIGLELFGDVFMADTNFKTEILKSIYAQYHTLLKRTETWQLGNHYFENLKTLIFCSLIFREKEIFDKNIKRFKKELREEILSDGIHFELSPMYHKVIQEDLIRVLFCLKQAGRKEYNELLPVLQQMTDAAVSMERGMGRTPLFNDSGDNVAKPLTSLLNAERRLFHIEAKEKNAFHAAGYYKLYNGNIALMMDAGKIGPDYMPGHGQCDCLSFELAVDARPLFVNSGTYQYQGKDRGYFRSTRAHNTIQIGAHEQSEYWGEHRVARRIKIISVQQREQGILGEYKNYLGERHKREICLSTGVLSVWDSVTEEKEENVHSYLHIAPEFHVFQEEKYIWIADRKDSLICRIKPVECNCRLHQTGDLTKYAPEFGLMKKIECLEFFWKADHKKHGYTVEFCNIKDEETVQR
ncbi:MAG: hypothetical protein HFI38_14325 [Lachnospiraceae bacterium]|jgi:uncharacterized heparinase superfamily protein|nr:hypothetical protein [Lachnospiraceae bacterium]